MVVPIDKASRNVALICKRLYCHTIREELTSSRAYESSDLTEKELFVSHEQFLKAYNLMGKKILPFMYMLPKSTKHRWVLDLLQCASNCSTSKFSSVLNDLLLFVLMSLRDKDNERIQRTGVCRYFVVDAYEEVTNFLSR